MQFGWKMDALLPFALTTFINLFTVAIICIVYFIDHCLYLHFLHLQCSNRMLLLDEYASQDKEEFTIELLNLSQVLKDSQSSVIYRVDDKAIGKNKVSP